MNDEIMSTIGNKIINIDTAVRTLLPDVMMYHNVTFKTLSMSNMFRKGFETQYLMNVYLSSCGSCMFSINMFDIDLKTFLKFHKEVMSEYAGAIMLDDGNSQFNFFKKYVDLMIANGGMLKFTLDEKNDDKYNIKIMLEDVENMIEEARKNK